MKLCKRMGLPKERAVSVPAVNGVARTSVPANTISLFIERLGEPSFINGHSQRRAMSSKELFSS